MLDGIQNYPLTWPAGWPRTTDYKRRAPIFANRTVAVCVEAILDELRLLHARQPVISTNLQLRRDGLPRSGQPHPKDPGVAVYFVLTGQPRVLACDRWIMIQDNLWAIVKHIDAIRGLDRWGVGTLDQAFTGYAALPAPAATWWEILGVPRDADQPAIREAYRRLAKQHHPDVGGDDVNFRKIQAAWEQANKERR